MVGFRAADADLRESAGRAHLADGGAGGLTQHVGHKVVALILDQLRGNDGDGLAEFFLGDGGQHAGNDDGVARVGLVLCVRGEREGGEGQAACRQKPGVT